MAISISVNMEKNEGRTYDIDKYPDECPICHHGIDPREIYFYSDSSLIQITFQCPRDDCHKLFVGYYKLTVAYGTGFLQKVAPKSFQKRTFSDDIILVSKDFTEIYNEAITAEEMGLTQICGPGYRKALEFLIKEYAIKKASDEKEKDNIRKKFLGHVIQQDITDNNIKTTAKLASWLGNDETHFFRKWEEMDIDDLKTLIEITVRWIESEEITKAYKNKMSEDSSKENSSN
ncbi:MAG: hypothetical protein MAG431_00012 [Chloroflexi bacterium]|nr:hypothetical protein [Chloroflexota bacterium]